MKLDELACFAALLSLYVCSHSAALEKANRVLMGYMGCIPDASDDLGIVSVGDLKK